MSIRLIALELYRLHQAVEKLEQQIRDAPYHKRPELENSLRKRRAEHNRIRNVLEGQKDDSKTRRF
jgi:hypothetical protein